MIAHSFLLLFSPHGQLRKYRIGEFGVCPLNECNGQPVLPIGLRDTLRYHEAMVYCPRCGLIFHPAQKQPQPHIQGEEDGEEGQVKQPPLDEGGSGRFVASYPDFIEYLREKHRSIRIGTLPFESKISAAHAGG